MRTDLSKWRNIESEKATFAPDGICWLRLRPFSEVEIIDQNGQSSMVVASATGEIRIRTKGQVTVKASSEGMIYHPHNPVITKRDEVFTNLDRLPHESGNVSAVTQALRLIELKNMHVRREEYNRQKQFMAEQRAIMDRIEMERANAPAPSNADSEPA